MFIGLWAKLESFGCVVSFGRPFSAHVSREPCEKEKSSTYRTVSNALLEEHPAASQVEPGL
jgi:hypothetical protein